MRRKPPHTERAAASHEAAALFCSTLSCFDLPLNANFEKITPLCAFACGRVRLFHAFKKRLWLRTHSGRPPPRQSEFLKFQIDRRKQPWLTTKPEPKNSGSNGKKQKKENSENSAWMRTPSSAFIHTIGRSSIRNGSTCSGRWNGLPMWS